MMDCNPDYDGLVREAGTKMLSEKAELRAENKRLYNRLVKAEYQAEQQRVAARQVMESLQARNDRLQEALQMLYDEQNGPPLLRWEDSWERAMEMAREVLEGSGD